MSKLDNYTRFFGGSCQAIGMIEEIKFFHIEIEKLIEKEKNKLSFLKVDIEKNRFLSDKKYHFDYTIARNLRDSVIINLVKFLEIELHRFCKDLQIGLSIPISHSDLKGTILEQFKIYSSQIAKLDINFQSIEWQTLKEIVELRNCIVHYDGWIEDFYGRTFSRVDSIKKLSKKIKSIHVDEKDFIRLYDKACTECICITENFIENLYRIVLEKFSIS